MGRCPHGRLRRIPGYRGGGGEAAARRRGAQPVTILTSSEIMMSFSFGSLMATSSVVAASALLDTRRVPSTLLRMPFRAALPPLARNPTVGIAPRSSCATLRRTDRRLSTRTYEDFLLVGSRSSSPSS